MSSARNPSHPIIDKYHAYYARNPFMRVIKAFLGKNPQSEIDIILRFEQMISQERSELLQWVGNKYGSYLRKGADFTALDARELTFIGLLCYYNIGPWEAENRIENANYFFELANKKGDPFALFGLAICASNAGLQEAYLKRAIGEKISYAKYVLAIHLRDSDPQKAQELLQEADIEGVPHATWELGNNYFTDLQEYLSHIRAAEHGMADALNSIAVMFGEEGIPEAWPYHADFYRKGASVEEYFYKVAAQRMGNAHLPLENLAICHEDKGEQVIAVRYYRSAAQCVLNCANTISKVNKEIALKEVKEELVELEGECKDASVAYHAAIVLQDMGDAQEQSHRRNRFNYIRTAAPEDFDNFAREFDDSSKVHEALIVFSEQEIEELRILSSIIAVTVANSFDVRKLILQYLCHLPMRAVQISHEEKEAANTASNLVLCTSLPQWKQLMLFGNPARLQVLKDELDKAKEHKQSHVQALGKVLGCSLQ